jgi:predicted nucleic-acid-binding Zn-ribbon protein
MGLFKSTNTAKIFEVKGKDVSCAHCQHDKFYQRSAQLNTSFLSFLGLDWLNRSAECLVCENCGYVHWFLVN